MSDLWTVDPREALRAGEEFDLDSLDRASTPGFTGDKAAAEILTAERGKLLSELQERLFNGRAGGKRNVLVIIQGLDTAGKGGIVRHVMGMVAEQGVALRSFGVPTAEERSHHYLWRIKKALPKPGLIGVFDRSQYEDVLVVRVDNLVEQDVWEPRFAEINRWERTLVNGGTTVLKFALMPSYDEQARRLMERTDRTSAGSTPPASLGTRSKWDQFQRRVPTSSAAPRQSTRPGTCCPRRPQVVPAPRHHGDPHPGPDRDGAQVATRALEPGRPAAKAGEDDVSRAVRRVRRRDRRHRAEVHRREHGRQPRGGRTARRPS